MRFTVNGKRRQNSATAQTRKHSDFNEIVYHGAPVSHWKLNETEGTEASDSVGDNNGTVSDAEWTSSGKIGYALEFDGSSDYVVVGGRGETNGGYEKNFPNDVSQLS